MKKLPLIMAIALGIATQVNAATITGNIKYEGKVPKFREIKMDADPICLTKHSDSVFPQTLVLGEGQTIANIFVHITKGIPNKNYPTPTEPLVLDQHGCMYTPHVSGAMVDQPIKILNPDGTLHNVHAVPKINAEFNLAMPKFRKEVTKSFSKPEMYIPFKCDVHPWMIAYVSIMEHPYFDTTEKDGNFEITNLPPGTYEVTAWHEKLGNRTSSITIAADDETQTVDFIFSRPDKK